MKLAMKTETRTTPRIFATPFIVAIVSSCAMNTGQSVPSLHEQIIGTWIPVSQYVEQDKGRIEPFGPDPKGMVVYDPNGRFSLVLQRLTLPKFASNNRLTGTPEENRAIAQGSIAYFGKYAIDEKAGMITMHFEGSTYPNWDGQDQTRRISISGDELSIVSPASAVGDGVVHLILRRAK